jgi:hypothetical protein
MPLFSIGDRRVTVGHVERAGLYRNNLKQIT